MKCRHVKRELSAYIDAAVSPQARIRIEKHLVKCAECSRYRDDLTRLVESVRRVSRIEPSRGFWFGVMGRVRAASKVPMPRSALSRRWAVAFVALVAVGMSILGLLALSTNRGAPAPTDASLLSVMATLIGDEVLEETLDEARSQELFEEVVAAELPPTSAAGYSGELGSGGVAIEEIVGMLSSNEKMELEAALLDLVKEG